MKNMQKMVHIASPLKASLQELAIKAQSEKESHELEMVNRNAEENKGNKLHTVFAVVCRTSGLVFAVRDNVLDAVMLMGYRENLTLKMLQMSALHISVIRQAEASREACRAETQAIPMPTKPVRVDIIRVKSALNTPVRHVYPGLRTPTQLMAAPNEGFKRRATDQADTDLTMDLDRTQKVEFDLLAAREANKKAELDTLDTLDTLDMHGEQAPDTLRDPRAALYDLPEEPFRKLA